jgi:hypothetical protein
LAALHHQVTHKVVILATITKDTPLQVPVAQAVTLVDTEDLMVVLVL